MEDKAAANLVAIFLKVYKHYLGVVEDEVAANLVAIFLKVYKHYLSVVEDEAAAVSIRPILHLALPRIDCICPVLVAICQILANTHIPSWEQSSAM